MSRPAVSAELEERVRAALGARAGLVGQVDLQPAVVPTALGRPRRWPMTRWWAPMAAAAAVVAVAVVMLVLLMPGGSSGPDLPASSVPPAPSPSATDPEAGPPAPEPTPSATRTGAPGPLPTSTRTGAPESTPHRTPTRTGPIPAPAVTG